jgi:NAD(P)-dependent dehydrogenase (short-subunit alcohol dehydrogenase family)
MRRSGRWATSWNRSATPGKIDILVNNAGITRDDLAMRMSDEAWADVLNVNLTGAFYMARAVLRPMLKARGGRIINMSSVSGQMGNADPANYSASKAGLIGLTKALAREVASRGITVNAIAPGFVVTELTDGCPIRSRMRSRPRRRWAASPPWTRSPRPSPSSPRTRRATSRARSWAWTAASR